MPVLNDHLSGSAQALARSAELAREQQDLLNAYLDADLHLDADAPGLSLTRLRAVEPASRRALLYRWIGHQLGLPTPPHAVLQRLDPELIEARDDATPLLAWPGGELRRFRDRIYAFAPLGPVDPLWQTQWDGASPLVLPASLGLLKADDRLPETVTVRFAGTGGRFRPRASGPSRSLKNLLREAGLPPWQRERTVVVESDGIVRWVGGIGASADADAAFQGLRLVQARSESASTP